ncbi:tyrosyl-DNA phosphodiesterase I [Parasitella parasitica]|nr:tyrosyl-DNA phosphodiesterase I [Parasitella parasitica]
MDYINDHFPLDVNVCIVTHGRPATRKQVHSHRVIIQPPLQHNKYGVFHPKLMLLFHATSVRVVIGSANLERYDYEDLENVVFIQDFPKSDTPHNSVSSLPLFARDICNLLDHMQVPSSVKDELLNYNFDSAKANIIASISGVFEGENEYQKYGHARLAEVVKDIVGAPCTQGKMPHFEMQTSSLGSLSLSYLNELYRSFCGIAAYKDGKATPIVTQKNQLPPIDIIYPSLDTVESSRLGPPGASTICLNTSTWRKDTFPRQVMCDAISQRQGTLMHSKYIVATFPNEASKSKVTANAGKLKGWMYCGSHNATMSAWGKFTVARDTKRPKMNISNWELGVVLPIYENSEYPAPYLRPAPRYQPSQQAWTQDMEY